MLVNEGVDGRPPAKIGVHRIALLDLEGLLGGVDAERMSPAYPISDGFLPDLRKLLLSPSGQHDAAMVSMARRLEPLPHAHRTQTDGAGAGGTRRPLVF
jgi:hypothetical protein